MLRYVSIALTSISYVVPILRWQWIAYKCSDHACGMWILSAIFQAGALAVMISLPAAFLSFIAYRRLPKPRPLNRTNELVFAAFPSLAGIALVGIATGLILVIPFILLIILLVKKWRRNPLRPPPLSH